MHLFPLKLSFKIAALAPQIYVRDASGNEILYVRQKILKLKDKIRVFADSSQTNQLYEIDADRVLDWSARFTFTDTQGRVLGAVGRLGAKSLWRATYEVADAAGRQIPHRGGEPLGQGARPPAGGDPHPGYVHRLLLQSTVRRQANGHRPDRPAALEAPFVARERVRDHQRSGPAPGRRGSGGGPGRADHDPTRAPSRVGCLHDPPTGRRPAGSPDRLRHDQSQQQSASCRLPVRLPGPAGNPDLPRPFGGWYQDQPRRLGGPRTHGGPAGAGAL